MEVISNNAKNAFSFGMKTLQNSTSDSASAIIVVIFITVLLFAFVIAYISFAMKNSSLKGKLLLGTPTALSKTNEKIIVRNSDIPVLRVGREYSYAFWLYVQQIDPSNKHKLVMLRGSDDNVQISNPIIMMDAKDNKLYFVIRTSESILATDKANTNINNDLDAILRFNYFENKSTSIVSSFDSSKVAYTNRHIILTVDYVPLQRWVHCACVVDNKVATLYIDGEIYMVKTIDDLKASRDEIDMTGRKVDYNLIVENTDGDVVIGKSIVGGLETINGIVSKVEFFNHAITSRDVQNIYNAGPVVRTWLSMFGVKNYGFRTPIYKLGATDSK